MQTLLRLLTATMLLACAGLADDSGGGDDRGGFKLYGLVQSMGTEWRVDGRSVRVSSSTRIGQGIAVGTCVEVEGALQPDSSIMASSISIDDKCAGSSGSSTLSYYGSVQSLPPGGLISGDWRVGSTTVRVTAATRIKQERGPLAMGSCVEVKGVVNPDGSIAASEIEVKSSSFGCSAADSPGSSELKFYGIIQTLPQSGPAGDWLVSGRLVHVLPATRISSARPFAVGGCVEVEGRLERDGSATAATIEAESSSCTRGVRNVEAPKFIGVVQRLPQETSRGDWLVSNRVVRVSDDTGIERERGQLAMSACVEVKGELQADNSIRALKIEVEDAARCGGMSAEGRFEHFGTIESLPVGAGAGDWRIGGRTVRVSSATSVRTEHGAVVMGACVETHGTLQADGAVLASRIEVLSSSGACLARNGVGNAASFTHSAVAPGLIVTIFGLNIGPAEDRRGEVVDDRWTSRLSNIRVLFDRVPAPLIFASTGQINAIVPYSVAGRASTEVQIENNGAWSNTVVLPVAATSPAIFTATGSGKGQGAILNYEAESRRYTVNAASNPAARGSYVSIYATGEGRVEPRIDDGRIHTSVLPRPVLPVGVSIGGRRLDDSYVQYAGAAPGMTAGLIQVNVRIPDDAPTGGGIPIVLMVGDARSRDEVTIAIR